MARRRERMAGLRWSLAALGLGVTVLGLTAGAAWAQCDVRRVGASDAADDGRFGVAVDVGDGHAVIGGRRPDGRGGFDGVVYVLARDARGNWTEIERLTAPTGAIEPGFGTVLAIDGDVLAIGHAAADDACPSDPGCDSGAVHVFVRDVATARWTFAQRLTAKDGAAGDRFGLSVSVDSELIVVGALGTAEGGAVHVFDRAGSDEWTHRARLTAPGQEPGSGVGERVAVDRVTLVATARAGGVPPPGNVPRVHVFERTNGTVHDWTYVTALERGGAATPDGFATSVALAGGTIVVGAPGDDSIVLNGGIARLFRRDAFGAWFLQASLLPPVPEPQRQFGASVAADGSVVAVSSLPLLSVGTIRTYLLREDGTPVALGAVSPEKAVVSDLFGWNVALDGDAVLSGAPGDDEPAPGAGVVYAYQVDRCVTCPADLDRSGEVDSMDLLTLLASWGSCPGSPCFTDLSGDDVTGFADLLRLLAAWGTCVDRP